MSKVEDGRKKKETPFAELDKVKGKPRIRKIASQQSLLLKANMTAFSPYCNCSTATPHLHETMDRLVQFDEVPKCLQFNKYVVHGYRQPLTYEGCAKSFFCCHNETMNILTHLVGLAIFVHEMMKNYWPEAPMMFYVTLLSFAACMLSSVMYHTFMNFTPHYDNWLKFDVCGIYAAFLFAQPAVVWFGFTCFPHLRVPFLVFYYSIGLFSAYKAVQSNSIKLRAKYMCFTGLARGMVLIARFLIGAGRLRVLTMYLAADIIGLVGAMINASQLPEKWYPGKFDFAFNSHQIMHIFAFVALYGVYLAISEDYLDYRDMACFPQTYTS